MSYFGDSNLAEHILNEIKYQTGDSDKTESERLAIIKALSDVIQYYSEVN